MSALAAYYTEHAVSQLLVSQLTIPHAHRMLDLGVGKGSLLCAAVNRWPDSRILAADLDPRGFDSLRRRYPKIHLIQTDGLNAHSCPKFAVEPGSIDVAVCNPPYLNLTETEDYSALLKEAGLPRCSRLKHLTSDVVFLAQNLRLLRKGGELGIILPDSVISGCLFKPLREDLLEHHELFGVIQMPRSIFRNTEALTHILLLRRSGKRLPTITLYQANATMALGQLLEISAASARKRMDYGYWKWRSAHSNDSLLTLASIGAEIKRGTITRKACLARGLTHFHTGDFPDAPENPLFFHRLEHSEKHLAKKGDILLARVGSRCVGRVAIVARGSRPFTDCIYRIRVPECYRAAVLESMAGKSGQQWFQAHAHGVCAQVISKADLLSFPINFSSSSTDSVLHETP
ncbi:MAG: N-6 DNA methylase [Sedimenticola sp.]